MRILGIETSCDETAAAVVEDGRTIHANVVASQISQHRLYGGVVPEIASRQHVEHIVRVTEQALNDAGTTLDRVDAVAVTAMPGLVGALLAGVSFAKGLSYAAKKPLVPVNHLQGHIASLYLAHENLVPPFVAFVVSGGHSHLALVKGYTEFEVLGRAVDDAAGEAFDKVARTLGLPYPGGPEISKLARAGQPTYDLPEPRAAGWYDVSFSGLKTAVLNMVNTAEMKGETIRKADLAASFEQRVVDMLGRRLVEAAAQRGLPAALCGGVAANTALRNRCAHRCAEKGIELYVPPHELTGDNAAMIAAAGYYEFQAGTRAALDQNAYAAADLDD
jgi:N6-L-threonylcarbamoyladenine synthase